MRTFVRENKGCVGRRRASQVALVVKNPLPTQESEETWVDPWVGKMPWRRAWQPSPVFLPGESSWTEKPGGLQSMGLQREQLDKIE